MGVELFVQSEGIKLTQKSGLLVICQPEKETPVNFKRIERIWLNPTTSIEGALLQSLLKHEIELVICSSEGTPLGFLSPLHNPVGAAARKKQILFSNSPEAKALAAEWIVRKQQRQLTLLIDLGFESVSPDRLILEDILQSNHHQLATERYIGKGDLQEAYFARIYWKSVSALLPPPFQFEKRSRQPAEDYFNAAINYGYGIFYGLLLGAVQREGLDPYLGYWHSERDGQPVLVYDAIEPFRPWVERSCIELCRSGTFIAEDFTTVDEGGIWLGDQGKGKLVQHLFDYLEAKPKGRRRTPKQEISHNIKQLRKIISGFKP